MPHFDLIVIGTGVAGRTAAEDAAAAGLRTALADEREFGGTCALRGCEPKKVLFAAAEAVHRVRAQAGNGVDGSARLDWAELVRFERGFTDSLPRDFERHFAELGVTALHGHARFSGPAGLRIGDEEHTADNVLVATGARPVPLPVPGGDLIRDSEHFMHMETMPGRVVFVGGGYISFELAAMALAAGASPVIVHRGRCALEQFDTDLVGRLVDDYRSRGIDVRLETPVLAIERDGASFVVQTGDGSAVEADLVVHGAGRAPDFSALDLPAAGVKASSKGVDVDRHMRSVSNDRVFAAGDASSLGLPLTPVAVAQARVAVRNIVSPGSAVFDPVVTPTIVFSDPPLASVGLSEREAREQGRDVEVRLLDTSGWASARRVGLRTAAAKTILERPSGRILGAHLLLHHADELVNLFALAISQGLTGEDLKAVLWGYPTTTSEIVYMI